MKRHPSIAISGLALALLAQEASAESFSQYVRACKARLAIPGTIPGYSCVNDTIGTALGGDTRLGRLRLSDAVDGVYLCRGINGSTVDLNGLILHNRESGETCFFDSLDVPVAAPSVESANAATYWSEPSEMTGVSRCIDCHTNGPYIMRNSIVDSMVGIGMVNNGRSLFLDRYHIVGDELSDWNDAIVETENDGGCANSCHSVTAESAVASSITGGWMPPGTGLEYYKFINRDRPSFTGDHELTSTNRSLHPLLTCAASETTSVVAVRSGDRNRALSMYTNDNLLAFNIHDGLICRNGDQPDNSCADYEVRYRCNDTWTAWSDRDDPSFTGDFERRNEVPGLCSSPTQIQATVVNASFPVIFDGFLDRVSFNLDGLRCNNADQPGGACGDYSMLTLCD